MNNQAAAVSQAVTADKVLRTVTYKIVKKGRKWFEGVNPGRGFRAQIEINAASQNFKIGETRTFTATLERKQGIGGPVTQLFPVTKAQQGHIMANIDMIARHMEIKKLLSHVEEYAKHGAVHQDAVGKLADLGIEPSRHARVYPGEAARLEALLDLADTKKLEKDIKIGLNRMKDAVKRFWPQRTAERVEDAIGTLSGKGLDVSRHLAKFEKLKAAYGKHFVYESNPAGDAMKDEHEKIQYGGSP